MNIKKGWITQQVESFIGDVILELISFVQKAVSNLFDIGTTFADYKEVEGAVNAASLMGIALIVILIGKEITTTYILETDGDPEGDPMQLVVKAAQTVCLISCNDFVFDFFSGLAKNMEKDAGASILPEKVFFTAEQHVKNMAGKMGVIMAGFILVYIIFTIAIALKAGIRGAELAFMKILWPILACDVVSVSAERWNTFKSSYVVTFIGYIPQLLAFHMSIVQFVNAVTSGDSVKYLAAGLWIYFAFKIPNWLEKYAYNSGLSRVARGGMGGMMQIAYLSRLAR